MTDFIGSTFTAASVAWVAYFGAQALGLEWISNVVMVTALGLSCFAFSSLIVGGFVWTARHIRITIV